MIRRTFILFLLLMTFSASGVTHYIRAGATGSNNGTDWNNAWTNIPASLTRGDVYYFADGSYGDYTVDAPASGTNFIWFRKATPADHGTETGWQDSYGTNRAVFHEWTFSIDDAGGDAGYFEINGYSTNIANRCGMLWTNLTIQEQAFTWEWASGNWPETKFKYIEVAGPMNGEDMESSAEPPWSYGFLLLPYNGSGYDSCAGLLISHCNLHGVSTVFQDGSGMSGHTIEYCKIYDSRVTGVDHENIYWIGSSDGVFRYNEVYNWNVEGLFFGGGSSGWKIYGNVFHSGVDVSRAVEWPDGRNNNNHKFFNNTIVNMGLAAVYVYSGAICSSNEIRNNVIYGNGIYLNGVSGITESDTYIVTNTSDFVNYAGKDFRLTKQVTGMDLGSEYNKDKNGVTRTNWTVGAYEFGSEGGGGDDGDPPNAPGYLRTVNLFTR